MLKEERLMQMVDWTLPPREFEEHIGQVIHQYAIADKVLPLPIELRAGYTGEQLLFIMLAKIDCSGCDALCCRQQPANIDQIAMDPLEYADLNKKYPDIMVGVQLDTDHIVTPCPLLKDGRCQVYLDRPFVCWLYPFQFGAYIAPNWNGNTLVEVACLSSSCPGARKLAKAIYLNRYQLRRSMQRLGKVPKDPVKGGF